MPLNDVGKNTFMHLLLTKPPLTCGVCGQWQSLRVAWAEGLTGNNENPGEPGGQILLHFIMEVACEGCLQLSDGGNQER